METTGRSLNHIFQGYMYLSEEKRTICQFWVTLHDPVDVNILQRALDAVMMRTDYSNVRLICEDEQYYLCPNGAPCVIYSENGIRQIPEETNGYLFYVSAKERTVYLTYWHFLSDGRGGNRFMNTLLVEYCNRRYGTEFVHKGLYTDPEIPFEEVAARYGGTVPPIRRMNMPESTDGEAHRFVMRVSKDSVVRAAAARSVKPFSYLLFALCGFAASEYGEEQISFAYPIDVREALGVSDALYNCACMQYASMDMCSAQKDQLLNEINDRVKKSLTSEEEIKSYIQCNQPCYDTYKSKKPMRVKQKLLGMLQRMGRTHVMLSYLGNPIPKELESLNQYIANYQVGLISAMPLFIAEQSYGQYMSLNVTERLGIKGIEERMRIALENESIEVLDVQEIY